MLLPWLCSSWYLWIHLVFFIYPICHLIYCIFVLCFARAYLTVGFLTQSSHSVYRVQTDMVFSDRYHSSLSCSLHLIPMLFTYLLTANQSYLWFPIFWSWIRLEALKISCSIPFELILNCLMPPSHQLWLLINASLYAADLNMFVFVLIFSKIRIHRLGASILCWKFSWWSGLCLIIID